MKLKKGYNYIYYLLYKSLEKYSVPRFWSDWKAEALMDILMFFLLFPLLLYYYIFTGKSLIPDNNLLLGIITTCFICGFNYSVFHYRNQWKDIVEEFEKKPSARKLTNKSIGWLVILLITAHMVFSFFMLDLHAQRTHTGPYSREYLEQR